MKSLYIMQGVPGSGKSTVAMMIAYWHDGFLATIRSADDFWYRDGIYCFDYEQLHLAHAWNQAHVEDDMRQGEDAIVVDNTNIRYRFAEPYFNLADEYGYSVQVVRVDPGLEECQRRNALRSPDRKCPEETIIKMYGGMEDLWAHRAIASTMVASKTNSVD